MEFVANYWWLWILTLLGSIGYALVHVLKRFKNTKDKFFGGAKSVVRSVSESKDALSTIESVETTVSEVMESVAEGIWKLIVAKLIALASAILLLISLVLNVAHYFN